MLRWLPGKSFPSHCKAKPEGSRLAATLDFSHAYGDCVHPKSIVRLDDETNSECPRLEPALTPAPHYILRPRSCEVCSSEENLKRCSNCSVTYYCSEEHQASDFARHAEKCHLAVSDWSPLVTCKHGNAKYIEDEQTLFKVDVTLHLFPSAAATEVAMRQVDRIFLRINNEVPQCWLGVYKAAIDLIPVLYVRQGQDENARDFIYPFWKRYFDELAGSLSFEGMLESAGLGHQVLLSLIAIKALRQFKDIENMSIGLRGHIAQEIIDEISKHLSTDFLETISGYDHLKATGDASWRREKISEWERVVMKCVYRAGCTNRHIWRLMLDTEKLAARTKFGQFNSGADSDGWDVREAAEIVAIRQYQVWMETPGSHDILRSAMAAVARRASVHGFSWPIERTSRMNIWQEDKGSNQCNKDAGIRRTGRRRLPRIGRKGIPQLPESVNLGTKPCVVRRHLGFTARWLEVCTKLCGFKE